MADDMCTVTLGNRFGAPPRASAFVALSFAVLLSCWSIGARSFEVEKAWLDRNCLDKGTGDHPLLGSEFEACLRKKIESLPPLDKSRREFFGEQYDPNKYVECRLRPHGRNDSACDVYTLRRRVWPEYWPEDAKRVTWPEAPKESVYRRGMTPKQYWEALCKAEAGEFIYKPVKDVEGFLLIRPRAAETDIAMKDKYVVEDAYGLREFYSRAREKRPGVFFLDRSEKTYRYVEAPVVTSTGERKLVRHEADISKLLDLRRRKAKEQWGEKDFSTIVEVNTFSSRYGLTWRGIRRERDVEFGISGGELAVVDLQTGETLAIRRGFALDPYSAKGANEQRWWLSSAGCPVMARDFLTLTNFMRRVLLPERL